MSLVEELKRRNVFRVAAAYLVVGWLFTEVLTTLLPEFGAPEWVIKAIMLVFALGFLPAIVFSWIYEITPDGIRKDHEVARDGTIGHKPKRLELITIGAVAVGIVFVAVVGSRTGTEDAGIPAALPVDNASVAVLPFVNMSGSEDNQYFSDGLTETLLHRLAQVPDLKVAARTSSFAFKDQNKTVVEIARALDVAHVLEGSVQRAGDRVRITAQLIRASDGFHVWSANYDRTVDDIFAIQDEIATKVGNELTSSLLGDRPHGTPPGTNTTSADAYDLYLQALQARTTFSYGGLQAAEKLLKGALTIDPDFTDAKTELASNYMQQVETGLMDGQTAFPEVVALSGQVLDTQPENANARALNIVADLNVRGKTIGPEQIRDAVAELETIVDEHPGELLSTILLVRMYQARQQFDDAIRILDQARLSDPYNARILYELGNLHGAHGQTEEARRLYQQSLDLEPAQPNALARLGDLGLREGNGREFLRYYLRAMETDPFDHELPGLIAGFLYELGLIDEGDDFRDRVLAIAPTSEIAYRINLLRAINSDDLEASVASARRAIEADVGDRRFSFSGAVQHLIRTAVATGHIDEELDYIQSKVPKIFDIDDPAGNPKYRSSQFIAFDAWYVSLPRDEMLARLDRLVGIMDSFGIHAEDNPDLQVAVLALRGERDAAIDVALNKIFTDSVAVRLGWRRTVSQAQFSDIVSDARVQAAMERWEAEEDQLRAQVKSYLAEISAAS